MVDAQFFYEFLAKPGVPPKQNQAKRKLDLLSYNATLNINSKPSPHRKLKIWCNIGPSSKDPAILEKLVATGMNVACLNFSLGWRHISKDIISAIREAEAEENFKSGIQTNVSLALETKGPEIHTGGLDGNKDYFLKKGQTLKLTTDKVFLNKGNETTVYIDYEDIYKICHPDDMIFIGDGTISLMVGGIQGTTVITTVEGDGMLKSGQAAFLPRARLTLPPLSEDDKENISFGIEAGVHYILASKVRNAADVTAIRKHLGTAGQHIHIVAKIECFEAINNIDEIMNVSDWIFINRHYIGVEVPPEKVFIAQKSIVAKCNSKGIPVIVARHFVTSMQKRRRPSRAEGLDIANAVLDGADGIYIAETAYGNYPVECVNVVHTICVEAESALNTWGKFREYVSFMHKTGQTQTIALCAVQSAYKLCATTIIAIAVTGATAKMLAKFKPHVPIIAIMTDEYLVRQVAANRAIYALDYPTTCDTITAKDDWHKFVEIRIEYGILYGKVRGFIRSGDPIVLVHGSSPIPGLSDIMRVIYASDIVKPIAY